MQNEVDLSKPLMPKATAVWLVENTALTFEQIATFTGLHSIEIQALADEDIGRGIVGRNPIENGELTKENIDECQNDPDARLRMIKRDLPPLKTRSKGPKYTPVSKRGDKPDAIAYILKHHPEITDAQITKLVGTTKPTINAVRERTHPNSANLRPRHPAELGLCSYTELTEASRKGLKAQGKDPDVEAQKKLDALSQDTNASDEDGDNKGDAFGGFDFSNFMSTKPAESTGTEE